jgi:hypothetical protein
MMLPITLVMVHGLETKTEIAYGVFLHVLREARENGFEFHSAYFFSPRTPIRGGNLWSHTSPMSYEEYAIHSIYHLYSLVYSSSYRGPNFSSHVMTIHIDGYPLNWSYWSSSFLKYDYLGAPWPESFLIPYSRPECRVGNSGFCLRSKAWLEASSSMAASLYQGEQDDVFMCVKHREFFLNRGLSIAPLDVALRFSFENPLPDFPCHTLKDSFGFHGRHNLSLV